MTSTHTVLLSCLPSATALLSATPFPPPQTLPPFLGIAATYAVFASTTITSTGATVITGDLGLYPGTSVTGFPPAIVVSGTAAVGSPCAAAALSALILAYDTAVTLSAAPLNGSAAQVGADLGGLTIAPGVYSSDTLSIAGRLTLMGGDSSVFIFRAETTLKLESAASVILKGGVLPCNVFWVVRWQKLEARGRRGLEQLCSPLRAT